MPNVYLVPGAVLIVVVEFCPATLIVADLAKLKLDIFEILNSVYFLSRTYSKAWRLLITLLRVVVARRLRYYSSSFIEPYQQIWNHCRPEAL